MIWKEPKDHSECYFCLTQTKVFTPKPKHAIKYPNISSAEIPVSCDKKASEEVFIVEMEIDEDVDNINKDDDNIDMDFSFDENDTFPKPHLLTQEDLNHFVRDLNLSKQHAELLGYRLKDWKLLHKDTRIHSSGYCIYGETVQI